MVRGSKKAYWMQRGGGKFTGGRGLIHTRKKFFAKCLGWGGKRKDGQGGKPCSKKKECRAGAMRSKKRV